MKWARSGMEALERDLARRLAAAPWPAVPEGFVLLGRRRPMRAVFAGWLEGEQGPHRVVLKRHQADTRMERLRRTFQRGRGPREGQLLRSLERVGAVAPLALAYGDGAEDFLLTEHLGELGALGPVDGMDVAQVTEAARLLITLHGAGLVHRDLHTRNLAHTARGLMLVDLGGAQLGAPLSEAQRIRSLAAVAHGLLGTTRRTQRLRALRVYTRLLHAQDPERAQACARAWATPIERQALQIARNYRRGRDRRAARSGVHFEVYTTSAGRPAVRHRDHTDERWTLAVEQWSVAWPDEAVPLKQGGRVVRLRAPDGEAVAVKRYDAVLPGRRARALTALRRSHALRNRLLPVPLAHLAAVAPNGSSVLVSQYLDHPDLNAFLAAGGPQRLGPRRWRRWLCCLGRTLRALHDADVVHRDLKAPNLLVDALGNAPCAWLADLEGARVLRAPPRWSRRARDLARLDRSLVASRTDRLRVVRAYLGVVPRPPVSTREFIKHMDGVRSALEARHAARYGSTAGPR